ncbi:hypothetical protein [Streptomyces hygroscopicus]|uniref:hypothetical protein n=1 Tax=Streptomyces hygroscopicus TaxID=1912 RepID=UPI00367F3880
MITLAAGPAAEYISGTLTSAGLALGISLFAVEHVRWWRGGSGGGGAKGKGKGGAPVEAAGKAKDPQALIPFWSGVAFGTLMVACPAGLLGTLAGFLRWGGNGLGGMAMDWMTGQDASTVATAAAPRLDDKGAIVVTALCIALWLLRKTFAKAIRGKFKWGVWAGTLVAIGTGVFAEIGNLVVPGVNSLGNMAMDGLIHGTIGALV